MFLPHNAFDALQDPWRNVPAIEAGDAVTLVGSVKPGIGQTAAAADAQGEQAIA